MWDDPKAAQEVMLRAAPLDEAINATKAIERELSDTAELIDMAEAGGRRAAGARSRQEPCRPRRAGRTGQDCRAAGGRGGRQQQLYRGQCRGWRHRKSGLGRNAAADVHALGRASRHEGRTDRPSLRGASRDQVGDASSKARMPMATSRRERSPPLGDQSVRPLARRHTFAA